jgi:hypothetical protein
VCTTLAPIANALMPSAMWLVVDRITGQGAP